MLQTQLRILPQANGLITEAAINGESRGLGEEVARVIVCWNRGEYGVE